MIDPLICLPPGLNPAVTQTKNYFAALENFQRTFAFKQGDNVLMLTDPRLDVRVTDAIMGLAKARGATIRQLMETTSQITAVPEAAKALWWPRRTSSFPPGFARFLTRFSSRSVPMASAGSRSPTFVILICCTHRGQAFRQNSLATSFAPLPQVCPLAKIPTFNFPTAAAQTFPSTTRPTCAKHC